MTLSVCIPCHNYSAEPLLYALRLEMPEIPILLVDDGSNAEYQTQNQQVSIRYSIDYKSFDTPLGRSEVRNFLARKAKTDHILFLDVDSLPVSPGFLKTYSQWLGKADVVCGGTRYSESPPIKELILRWKYGHESEEVEAEKRQKSPFERLTFNNIMIKRDLFLAHPLETLKHGYGHEDTLWGLAISGKANIRHIENPVYHTGLESNEIFLRKTKMAVENLAWLIKEKGLNDRSSLSRLYHKLRRSGLLFLIIPVLGFLKKALENQLTSGINPRLPFLKMLKLYWFAKAFQAV